MRRQQLWVLNAALAGCAIWMGIALAAAWKRGNERYEVLRQRSATLPRMTLRESAPPPLPSVGEIVAKNLFAPDRNNDRPQEMPFQAAAPLPVVIGTMRLGREYEALMSEGGQPGSERFRRVKIGDRVGPYTVSEIRDEAVVVEHQGQRTVINVYQSARSVLRAAAPPTAAPAAAPRPPAAPVVETAAPVTASVPAAPPQPAARPPAASAMPGVRVTIEGNRRRYERDTAFGPQVWYEDIR